MNPICQTFTARLADFGSLGRPINLLAPDTRAARAALRRRIVSAHADGGVLYRRDWRGNLKLVACFGEVNEQ